MGRNGGRVDINGGCVMMRGVRFGKWFLFGLSSREVSFWRWWGNNYTLFLISKKQIIVESLYVLVASGNCEMAVNSIIIELVGIVSGHDCVNNSTK